MQGRDYSRQQLPGSRTTPPSWLGKHQAASIPNRATHSYQQPAGSPGRANNLSAQLPPPPSLPQGLLAGKKRVRFAGVDADDCQPCGAACGCRQQPIGTAAKQQASSSTASLEATAAGAGLAQHPCSTQTAFPARAGQFPQHSLSRGTVHATAAGPVQHAVSTPEQPMAGSPAGAGHHPPQHRLSTVCKSAPSHPAGLPTPLQHHKPEPGPSTNTQQVLRTPGTPATQQQPAAGLMDAIQSSSHALPSLHQADHQHNTRHDLLLVPQSSRARSTALEALTIASAMAEEGKVASTPENQPLAMTISAVLGSGKLLVDANTAQQLAELLCPATTTLAGMTFTTAGPLHYRPVQYDFPPKWQPTESRPELHDAQLLSLSGLQTACQPLWPPATRAALLTPADDAASGPCNMFMPGTGLLGFFWQGQGLLRQCLQSHVVLDPNSPLPAGKQLKQHIYSRAYMAELLGSVYNLLKRGYPKEQPSAAAAPSAGTPNQAGSMSAQEAAASTSESSDVESYQMLMDALRSAEANLAHELKAPTLLAAEAAAPAASAAATLPTHHAGPARCARRAHVKQVRQQAPRHQAALLVVPEPLSDADAATLAAACRTAPGLAHAECPFYTNKHAGSYQTWPIAAPANTTKSFILSFCPEAGQLAQLRREEASALQTLPIQTSTPGQPPAHGEGVLPEAVVVATEQLSSKSGLSAACSFIKIKPLRRRLCAALDTAARSPSLGLLDWFLAAHAMFLEEWQLEAFMLPKNRKPGNPQGCYDPAKALEVAVRTRISFARLLLLTYNLLLQGQQQPVD